MGTLGGIPLDVGDVLAKKYRLERLVGEGGTGVVVAARHLQLERDVAIKFLRTALASDEVRLRFEREARAIGQIESEHVVSCSTSARSTTVTRRTWSWSTSRAATSRRS